MESYSTFFNWLDKYGAVYPKLYLKHHTTEYRSILAKENINGGDEILLIPEKLIITYEKTLESPIVKKVGKYINCEHTNFSIYLLEEKEKGEKSFWFPYINCLPKTYEDMPQFFQGDKLRLIQNTLAHKKIILRNRQLKDDYDQLCKLDSTFSRFSLRDFTWGRLVTITRIFGFNIGELKTSGLVPMADMLNHKKPDSKTGKTDTHWDFNDKKFGFLITANKSIKKEREIFDSYGFKCNTRFFVNYGFTVLDNDEDDETYLNILNMEFNVPGFYQQTREGDQKTENMFNLIRNKVIKITGREKSIFTELETLKLLNREVKRRILEFSTDLKTYEKLIEEEKDFSTRNCYVMCHSELKILYKYDYLCNLLIPMLEIKNYKGLIDKKGRLILNSSDLVNQYAKNCILPLLK